MELAEARKEMPALAHKKYDACFHPAMMSEEESEGEIIWIVRPTFRSSYLNTVYEASRERTKRRRADLPGNCYQPRERRYREIEAKHIPDVRQGDDLLKIPQFAFSKAWRKANKGTIDLNTHRIDKTLTKGPDITDFLAKYPVTKSTFAAGNQPVGNDPGDDPGSFARETDRDGGEFDEGFGGGNGEEFDGDDEEEVDDQPEQLRGGRGNAGEVEAEGKSKGGGSIDAGPIVDEEQQSSHPKGLAGHIDIDPSILSTTGSNPTAPQKTKPKPKLRPPPADPVPTSSIRIDLPKLDLHITKLPQPHPDHETTVSEPLNSEPEETRPGETPAEDVQTVAQMPPGGPQEPPPPLDNTIQLSHHPESPSQSTNRPIRATRKPKPTGQEEVGNGNGPGEGSVKKRGQKGGVSTKGLEESLETQAASQATNQAQSGPATMPKRPVGRPRKYPKK